MWTHLMNPQPCLQFFNPRLQKNQQSALSQDNGKPQCESQCQSGIGATICQAQGGPSLTPARVKTSIHQKNMTNHEKFILSKPSAFTLHSEKASQLMISLIRMRES